MGFIKFIKEEMQVIRERDPAMHSNMEVFCTPASRQLFITALHINCMKESIISGQDGFPRKGPERQVSKFIPAPGSAKDCLSTTAMA